MSQDRATTLQPGKQSETLSQNTQTKNLFNKPQVALAHSKYTSAQTKIKYKHCFSNLRNARIRGPAWWLTPVIPALWEAEVSGSRGQEIETILVNMVKPRLLKIQKLAGHGGAHL